MTFSDLVFHTASATTIKVNACSPYGSSYFNINPRDYFNSSSESMRKIRLATWDAIVNNIHPIGEGYMEVTLHLKELVII